MNQQSLFPESQKINPPEEKGTHPNTFAARKRKASYQPSNHHIRQCRNCEHLRRKRVSGRNFYKCNLIGIGHTGASDIRLKYVCNNFQRSGSATIKQPKKITIEMTKIETHTYRGFSIQVDQNKEHYLAWGRPGNIQTGSLFDESLYYDVTILFKVATTKEEALESLKNKIDLQLSVPSLLAPEYENLVTETEAKS